MQGLEEGGLALSPWGMFLEADVIVQAVMLGLAFASVVVWTILIAKSLAMSLATRRLNDSLAKLKDAPTLSSVDAGALPAPIARALTKEAADEFAASVTVGATAGVRDRIAVGMERLIAREARRVGIGVGTVATIGSTAPFVGLFGTVWGIMNSFIGIAKTHTTNLAVVAPGIAEALLATALGLVVAIPAVIIYNHFTRAIGAYRALVSDIAAMITRLASRELDQRLGAAR